MPAERFRKTDHNCIGTTGKNTLGSAGFGLGAHYGCCVTHDGIDRYENQQLDD